MKISKVIFYIKLIPSHPWWECKKENPPVECTVKYFLEIAPKSSGTNKHMNFVNTGI